MDWSFQPETQEAVSWYTVSERYGQFMNHAPGSLANAMPVLPVVVEGRLRVGFVATKDIAPGQEIVWDYGVRGEPWQCRSGKTSFIVIRTMPTSLLFNISKAALIISMHLSTFILFHLSTNDKLSQGDIFHPNRIGANQTNRGGKNTWIILCLTATKYSPLLNLVCHLNFNFRP